MTGEPLLSAMLLGFVLGLQHATDPDHLVAVGTILTGERRFRDGALVGAIWGLGHTLTLGVVGGALLALNLTVRPEVGTAFELLVAAVIVGLGALRLREALRGFSTAPPDHLLADHEHDGRAAFHSHPHRHHEETHAHPHVHPSPPLLQAIRIGGGGRRAFVIGAVHGLAGTAAISLLVLTTMRSALGGLAYLAVFGLGTMAGMMALTAALAYPLAVAARFRRIHHALAIGSGVVAIVFGLVYAAATI
jgi:hypothetical protein